MTKPDINGIISSMENSAGRLLKVIIQGFLSLIYPPSCQACNKKTVLFGNGILCENCYNNIRLNTSPKYNYGKANAYCFEASYSVCAYEGVIRKCVHNFKYNAKFASEKLFGKLMIEFAERHIDMRHFDWLVPVPLHRVKQRERTFNQSAILAVHLSKRFKVPILRNNLLRKHAGEPQITLAKDKRSKNVRDAFAMRNPLPVKNKNILLVDDVFTTGATANECSKTIKKAGAGSIEVFTLARSMQS